MKLFPLVTVGVCAVSAACTVTVDTQSQILRDEKRFTVSGTPDVRLRTFDGSIEVRSWDRPEVQIEIEKRGPTRESLDSLQIVANQQGNVVELEVKSPRRETFTGVGFHQSVTARLIVLVPRRSDVRANTGDGSINVQELEGRIDLKTGDGSIRASDIVGELIVDTGDGSVIVEDADGRLSIDTNDGGVTVGGKLTALKIRTGDGAIVYRAKPGTVLQSDCDISTGDGSVSLYLSPDFGAELDAHTSDGRIVNELRLAATATESDRGRARGKLGSGGKMLRVRTGDGTIRLRAY
jgi:putative adhesin